MTQERNNIVVREHVWGLDLSRSLQGAGGVGELLATEDSSGVYYVTFDANGNVSEYVKSSDNTVAAHYEYEPFGQTTATGSAFSFRFSTKYLDAEIGLYYYGYRYYSAELGRWIRRDPIGEQIPSVRDRFGGIPVSSTRHHVTEINLYAYVLNNPVGYQDGLGLAVHLSPLNGRAKNHSTKATITIWGDYNVYTFTKGSIVNNFVYWDEITKEAAFAWYTALGYSTTVTAVPGVTHDLKPGHTMYGDFSAAATLIVDSDRWDASTVLPVYKDKKCCGPTVTLPIWNNKWRTLHVYDCPDGIEGVYYKQNLRLVPGI